MTPQEIDALPTIGATGGSNFVDSLPTIQPDTASLAANALDTTSAPIGKALLGAFGAVPGAFVKGVMGLPDLESMGINYLAGTKTQLPSEYVSQKIHDLASTVAPETTSAYDLGQQVLGKLDAQSSAAQGGADVANYLESTASGLGAGGLIGQVGEAAPTIAKVGNFLSASPDLQMGLAGIGGLTKAGTGSDMAALAAMLGGGVGLSAVKGGIRLASKLAQPFTAAGRETLASQNAMSALEKVLSPEDLDALKAAVPGQSAIDVLGPEFTAAKPEDVGGVIKKAAQAERDMARASVDKGYASLQGTMQPQDLGPNIYKALDAFQGNKELAQNLIDTLKTKPDSAALFSELFPNDWQKIYESGAFPALSKPIEYPRIRQAIESVNRLYGDGSSYNTPALDGIKQALRDAMPQDLGLAYDATQGKFGEAAQLYNKNPVMSELTGGYRPERNAILPSDTKAFNIATKSKDEIKLLKDTLSNSADVMPQVRGALTQQAIDNGKFTPDTLAKLEATFDDPAAFQTFKENVDKIAPLINPNVDTGVSKTVAQALAKSSGKGLNIAPGLAGIIAGHIGGHMLGLGELGYLGGQVIGRAGVGGLHEATSPNLIKALAQEKLFEALYTNPSLVTQLQKAATPRNVNAALSTIAGTAVTLKQANQLADKLNQQQSDNKDKQIKSLNIPSLVNQAHAEVPIATDTKLTGLAALVAATMKAESAGNPSATSDKGAQGLMQLMPSTGAAVAKDLHIDNFDPKNPAHNLMAGITYLGQQLKAFDGSPELALAAYNWGPPRVKALVDKAKIAGINPTYANLRSKMPTETRNYIDSIMKQLEG